MVSIVTLLGGIVKNTDDLIPCVIESDEKAKPNRNWARLIQKIFELDPLTCPQCQGIMRVISIIEDEEVINKILLHLGLWPTKQSPPTHTKNPQNSDRLLRLPAYFL